MTTLPSPGSDACEVAAAICHARNAQSCVTIANDAQGRDIHRLTVQRGLEPPVDVKVPVIVQAATEPVFFRNGYLVISQEVYRYDDAGRRPPVPYLKRELQGFSHTFLRIS